MDFKNLAYIQREEYISTLNHDLKIPLIAQIRALELLLKENLGSLNIDQKEMLSLTLSSCKSMYKMISSILSSYKYENKDIILDWEIADVFDILNSCLSKSNNLLSNKNINFIIKSQSAKHLINADKIQLKKAFEYVTNYCISNSVSNIECKINSYRNLIRLKFTFENPFNTKDDLTKVFLSRMNKVGCSLSLYLAKQIINAHNGAIKLYKKEDLNICSIFLPIANT